MRDDRAVPRPADLHAMRGAAVVPGADRDAVPLPELQPLPVLGPPMPDLSPADALHGAPPRREVRPMRGRVAEVANRRGDAWLRVIAPHCPNCGTELVVNEDGWDDWDLWCPGCDYEC